MSAQAYTHLSSDNTKGRRVPFAKKKAGKDLTPEDAFILSALEKLKKDLDTIHRNLDSVTDPVLIDSFIYEMNALHMRYKFYLQQCKDKELISVCFD